MLRRRTGNELARALPEWDGIGSGHTVRVLPVFDLCPDGRVRMASPGNGAAEKAMLPPRRVVSRALSRFEKGPHSSGARAGGV